MDGQAAAREQRQPADRVRNQGRTLNAPAAPSPPPHRGVAAPAALAARLGHPFRRPALLAQALTHRSFGAVHNERLEFIGDAVLDCVVAAILYERFPALPEGDLSRIRAHLVRRDTLARLARALDLGRALRVGDGEQRSGGVDRASTLADALEAVFGAVFLDGGFDAARAAIIAVYGDDLATLAPTALGKDPKTRLQEWLQARKLPVPAYVVVAAAGEAHAQSFTVECRVAALGEAASGSGTSRRAAEQAAAAVVYARLAGAGEPAATGE
jgi:ribonuclease-3